MVTRTPSPATGHPIVQSSIRRSLARRAEAYEDEVGRLVDATYRVIARNGSVDPTVRDILAEAGLSTQAFYRHFRSKDDLFVVLLDDGRHRIVDYLTHRMDAVADPAAQIEAFVRGVMAQAGDREAAERTRPFVVQQDRLADRFAEHQRTSIEGLVSLLHAPLGALGARDVPRDAAAIYQLAFASMEQHVRDRTAPSADEIDHLVGFCLRAVGVSLPRT
jgi:AcrR family transcriptional regulator